MATGVAPEQVVAELTWARTRPSEVAAALRERLRHYKGKDYFPPERPGRSVATKEGTKVVEEAIAYMEALEPMGGVGETSVVGLAMAAEDHVADIGYTGVVAHNSSDGTGAADRAVRYGSFRCFGEALWYGSQLADARSMVLDLIVDDGVASRGHRTTVTDARYDTVGVAYGPHATFGTMTAIELAKGWTPDVAAIQSRQASGPVKVAGQDEAKKSVKTQWKLGGCIMCGEEIKGGAVVEVEKLGGKMHRDCFKCGTCSKQLSGVPWMEHERMPFCKSCYFEKHGEKCSACGKVIEGGMVKCSLGKFHVECVVCTTCNKSIGKAAFSTANGVISCQSCATQRQRSSSMSKLTGTGGASLGAPPPAGGRRGVSPQGRSSAAAKSLAVPKAGGASSGAAASSGRPSSGTARGPVADRGGAAAKAKAKAKPREKVALATAGARVVGMGMDYASLG
mmetsp:Transcript_86510/g.218112  ORF Transcript_86510/g.218112 Transcript_86510/m.218112 type:complete len:452 (-) Transcript_86510:97-1452(-)